MFQIGKEYKRRKDIHDLYGGQAQGGISTPKNHPVIFIFTSTTGEQHGYRDEFRENGTFWYTGEGQVGDMKMVAGNKAILEHAKHNKTIHIFEYTKRAHVRYIGSAVCLGFHEELRPDRDGNERSVFIFHLDIDSIRDENTTKASITEWEEPKKLKRKSTQELRAIAVSASSTQWSVKEKKKATFYRSQAIKLYVVSRSNGVCEGCGDKAPFNTKTGPYLECHHVHRLADGGPDDPKNVVALCPNCHRRSHFSRDSVTFNDHLKLLAVSIESSVISEGKAQS